MAEIFLGYELPIKVSRLGDSHWRAILRTDWSSVNSRVVHGDGETPMSALASLLEEIGFDSRPQDSSPESVGDLQDHEKLMAKTQTFEEVRAECRTFEKNFLTEKLRYVLKTASTICDAETLTAIAKVIATLESE